MSCGMGVIKYLLFIFNFIFALCGLAILIAGVVVHLQLSDYTNVIENNISFPSITLIVLGCIIFVIAFFGCCGAIRESHCMTVTFASLLLALLIIQVAVTVFIFVVFKDIDVEEAYAKQFRKYWQDKGSQEIVNVVQSSMHCCGLNSKNDYISTPGFNSTIPWSCCGKVEGQTCNENGVIYDIGCSKELKSLFTKMMIELLGGLGCAIAGVELIGIIFALCLANSIKNYERRGYRV